MGAIKMLSRTLGVLHCVKEPALAESVLISYVLTEKKPQDCSSSTPSASSAPFAPFPQQSPFPAISASIMLISLWYLRLLFLFHFPFHLTAPPAPRLLWAIVSRRTSSYLSHRPRDELLYLAPNISCFSELFSKRL